MTRWDMLLALLRHRRQQAAWRLRVIVMSVRGRCPVCRVHKPHHKMDCHYR